MSGVKCGVLCRISSLLLRTRYVLESKQKSQQLHMSGSNCLSSKTSQQYAPFTGCIKTTPVHQETDWNRHAGTCYCLLETSEGRQWAEASSDWNVVSKQQSFIDKETDKCKIVLMHVSNPKANTEHLLQCFSVTVMTFYAYVTAVMNQLTCFVCRFTR